MPIIGDTMDIYRILYKNTAQDDTEIQILDQKFPDATMQNYIDLIGGAQPCSLSVVDNDEETYGDGVISKRYTFSFRSTFSINGSTFSVGNDRRWFVFIKKSGVIVFEGWLVMDDNRDKYLPPGQDVILSATDNLKLLQGIEFSDFDGSRLDVNTQYTMIDYLCRCLAKTGLKRYINIVDNLFEEHHNDRDADIKNSPWNQTWLFPARFEKEVNVMLDCNTVLSMLMNKKCRISQHGDEWWIVRIAELKHRFVSYTKFTWDGTAASGFKDQLMTALIGHADTSDNYFNQEATQVNYKRPNKFTAIIFKYETPRELPCNKDFTRGDVLDDSNPLSIKYDVDCWEKLWSNTLTDDAEPNGIYIRRTFVNPGYETERYLVLEHNTIPHFRFAMSQPILVNAKDKFNLSTPMRLSSDVGGAGFLRYQNVQVRLYGDDGSFWTHHGRNSTGGDKAKWFTCDNIFRSNQKFWCMESDQQYDQTQSIDLFDGASAEIPVDGYLRILLYMNDIFAATKDTYYGSINFDYIPFLNGSYSKYTGERYTNTQPGDFTDTKENQIYLADSLRKPLLGALFYDDGGIKKLTSLWKDWAAEHAGITIYPHDRLAAWINNDHFNHYRKKRNAFDLVSRGLKQGVAGEFIDMHHLFLLDGSIVFDRNKSFIPLRLSQNWYDRQNNGGLIEIDDLNDQWAAADSFTKGFRYIET